MRSLTRSRAVLSLAVTINSAVWGSVFDDPIWIQANYPDPEPPSTTELVATYFELDDIGRALAVIQCESAGDPDAKNPYSTASGLFQHLASMWPDRSAKAGWAGYSVFDPEANVAVAAWLVYDGGGWSHWNASWSCWHGNEVPVITVDLVAPEHPGRR